MNNYINIQFQDGPIKENGVNGCQTVDVLDVLIERTKGFQDMQFACIENELILQALEQAKYWDNRRTEIRQRKGVEGRNINH